MAWQGKGAALSLDESWLRFIETEVRPAKADAVTRTEPVQRHAPSEAAPPQKSFGFTEQASARSREQPLAVPCFSAVQPDGLLRGSGSAHGGAAKATAAACTRVLCPGFWGLRLYRKPVARDGTRGTSWLGRSIVLDLDNGEPQLCEKTALDKNLAPSDGEEETSLCGESACGPLGAVAVILAAAAFQT